MWIIFPAGLLYGKPVCSGASWRLHVEGKPVCFGASSRLHVVIFYLVYYIMPSGIPGIDYTIVYYKIVKLSAPRADEVAERSPFGESRNIMYVNTPADVKVNCNIGIS